MAFYEKAKKPLKINFYVLQKRTANTKVIMETVTTVLSGVGISVVGLCMLRTWRSRSWGSISRIARLSEKSLSGQVIQ
jgi:hypothetical protein